MIMSDNSWHLSKSVPITLLFAIFLQTVAVVWWASGVTERVTDLETSLLVLSDDLADENLRQWARINAVENLAEQVASNSRLTTALMSRLEDRVESLTNELKETNRVLRENYSGTE